MEETMTVEEGLNMLESPYKEMALAELRKKNGILSAGDEIEYLFSAVNFGFNWRRSPQGHEFWQEVCHGRFPPVSERMFREAMEKGKEIGHE
jgi:hypothetical protein